MAMKKILRTAACAAALSLMATNAQAAGELFLYNWSNYFPPDLLKKFEADTGITVTLDVYDSNETMLAKLQAGASGYDVVVPSDYMVKIMIDEGLAEKIDAGTMSNFQNIMAPHDKQSFDPNREYSAPYMWGTTGFTYDSAKAGELENSWKEVFEPGDALKGQIAMLNDEVEVYNAAAYYTGVSKCTESSDDAQKILAVLEKQKPFVATYNSDGTIDRMAAGEVVGHMQWNGASHRTREKLPTATYMYPKEGLSFWADNFVVPTSAPNKENAKIFVNWMMAPENAAIASNFTGYMNAVRGSDKFLDDSLKTDPAVAMPEEYADRLRPALDCSPAARELRNKVWTRLKK
jgi:spermidine/putrescine transport system substrate-binding protein